MYSGILEADLQARQHLLPLTLDLGRRRTPDARAMSDSMRMPGLEAVLHHDHVDEGEVGRRRRRPSRRR